MHLVELYQPGYAGRPVPIKQRDLMEYIAYARAYCHPVLSPAAALVLQDFYISLRERHGDDDESKGLQPK